MELFAGASGRSHCETAGVEVGFSSEVVAGAIDQIYRLLLDGLGSLGLIKHGGRECALAIVKRSELSTFETLGRWRALDEYAEQAAQEVAETIRDGLHCEHAVVSWRNLDSRRAIAVGFAREEPDAHLSADEFALLTTLEPHLLRSLRIDTALYARERALDKLSEGIVLVNSQGAIGFANASAQQVLDARRGVVLSQRGVLTARDPACRKSLRSALSSVASGAAHQLPLTCTSAAHPYRATIVPLATDELWGSHSSEMIAVFFADPNRLLGETVSWLMAGYELTPTEAKVAACIAQGRSLETTAAQHGIRPNTVRSHLKQVFAKMGVNRQIEVARAVVLGTSGLRALGRPLVECDDPL